MRFSKESIENIYLGKEITREDGSKVRLFLSVPANDEDDKKAQQTVQVAVVDKIGEEVRGVEVNDLVIVNYNLLNLKDNFVSKDDSGIMCWLDADTIYHKDTRIAYANRKSHRDQIAWQKGDVEELGMLIAIIRKDKIYARAPYVLFEHTDPEIHKETKSGIIYKEQRQYLERRILAISENEHELKNGSKIIVYETDIFEIQLNDKSMDCCLEFDICLKVNK